MPDLRTLQLQYENTLDDMLRDWLVCGIRDASVQRSLLAEPDLTFKKAMELAQTAEMAAKNSKQLQNTPSSLPKGSVHAVNSKQRQQKRTPPSGSRDQFCYRCGNKHTPSQCRFKDATCKFCFKKGAHCQSVLEQKQTDGSRTVPPCKSKTDTTNK